MGLYVSLLEYERIYILYDLALRCSGTGYCNLSDNSKSLSAIHRTNVSLGYA
ncbi:hypothetical protein NDI48_28240 [Microcoleus sp. AS-A8]|jgi:hypothetical protein